MRYVLVPLAVAALFGLIFVFGSLDRSMATLADEVQELTNAMTEPVQEVRLPEYETPYTDGEGQIHIVRTYPDEASSPAGRAQLHKQKLDALKEVFPPPSGN